MIQRQITFARNDILQFLSCINTYRCISHFYFSIINESKESARLGRHVNVGADSMGKSPNLDFI